MASKKKDEAPAHGGVRKGAGRPSKADERGLATALNKAYKRVLKALPEAEQKKYEDKAKGSDVVIQTMVEMSLGVHSYDKDFSNEDLALADLKKRFEATKEIQKLYYGPSPEGIVGSAQNTLEITDIASLVSFGPAEDQESTEVEECSCGGDCICDE